MEGDDISAFSPETAIHACAPCKRNKRRCDKLLPSCGSCLKTGRVCEYSDVTSSLPSQGNEISDLQRRVQELEEVVLRFSNQTPHPPEEVALDRHPQIQHGIYPDLSTQAFYLDSEVWSSLNNVPDQSSPILVPEEISAALGNQSDIDNIKACYFQSVHAWMPFVSKIRVQRLTQRPPRGIKVDIALLLLCMKLVQEIPDRQSPKYTELYKTATQFSKTLELEGVLTLRTIQAGVLLVVYELGHGIFPAAFTRISYCARQGVALGLHNKLAPQLAGKPRSWVDWEERQRVWWMIVILDRYITLGGEYRPLCTEDPGRDTLLPAEDAAWNNGDMVPPERVSLSSQNIHTLTLAPFARLAQASSLLGRVIRHCNDTTLELAFILDDFETLYQAIYSLLELLSRQDGPLATIDLTIARTICFSALFKLSNHHSCDMFNEETQYLDPVTAPRVRDCMQKCLHITKDICGQVTSLMQEVKEILSNTQEDMIYRVSPLMLDCFYVCAQNIAWMALETNHPQYLAGRGVCEEMLGVLDGRWRVAGVYLELLRVSDEGMRVLNMI